MIKVTPAQIFAVLKAMPLVRFALMLGGGVVAAIAGANVQLWILYAEFPDLETIWLARIKGAVFFGLSSWAIVAIVMVMLAFGRAGKLGVKVAGVEVDVDFDNPDQPSGGAS